MNVVVFMMSLFQMSMLKHTLQSWKSIINTEHVTLFGTQRAMNEVVLMASELSRIMNSGTSGLNGSDANGCNSGSDG